ncbi:hypothetical protein KI688_003633 [Linnemannia hyalina]|uniref:Uncharacterized protein n=1 Tax=Linnemannia hyalina TaxID=64524 RepID=A0A9P7XPU3_9FUNG|nr:hypothetical protein KI688_003633 [Linnemannia hyalina]
MSHHDVFYHHTTRQVNYLPSSLPDVVVSYDEPPPVDLPAIQLQLDALIIAADQEYNDVEQEEAAVEPEEAAEEAAVEPEEAAEEAAVEPEEAAEEAAVEPEEDDDTVLELEDAEQGNPLAENGDDDGDDGDDGAVVNHADSAETQESELD